jgi:hypothetical protein
MDRVAAQTFRILGIVAISIVIIVAALIFAIASLCGLWSSSSSADEGLKLGLGIGCPVILIGGIFLIAKLAKGIARSRREANAAIGAATPIESATPEARDFTAEVEPLLHLRIAVAARILLSAAMLTYRQVQPTSYGRQYLFAAVLGFVVYEAPNGWVLWRIREKLDRFAVFLAVAYAAVSLLWTMWNFTMYFRFVHNIQMLPTWLLTGAAEAAVIIIGWRARMALPRRTDDDSTFAAAGGIALIYTFIAYGLTNIFYRMGPFR